MEHCGDHETSAVLVAQFGRAMLLMQSKRRHRHSQSKRSKFDDGSDTMKIYNCNRKHVIKFM